MRGNAKSCSATLREIEDRFNEGKELSLAASMHLKDCKECQTYVDAVGAFRVKVRGVYANLDNKNPIRVSRTPEQKIVKRNRTIPLVAAAIFCITGAFFVLPYIKSGQPSPDQYTKSDTDNFVDGIFSSPILDNRVDTAEIWDSSWFEDSMEILL